MTLQQAQKIFVRGTKVKHPRYQSIFIVRDVVDHTSGPVAVTDNLAGSRYYFLAKDLMIDNPKLVKRIGSL